MARNDRMVKVDGAAIEQRRNALGLTRAEIAAETGSPSESTWEAMERGRRPEFAERTVAKVLATLDRLEAERVVPPSAAARIDELEQRLEAVEKALQHALDDLQADRGPQ